MTMTRPATMRALVLDAGGEVHLAAEYPVPTPPPGEALIRVRMAGICNTDLELMRGYLSFAGVLGHEFVGDVVAAPDAPAWEGRRVVGEINAACGACPTCRAGRPTHCPHRTTLGIDGRDGALAEYLTLPIRNLHPVPKAIPDAAAVFTEPLAAACEIPWQLHIRPTDRVVVIGDGKLGLLCAQVVRLTGCDLIVVGHHEEKLALLARQGIATAANDAEVAPGADVVIEATGNPSGYVAARRLVRPRGAVVLKSTYHGALEADLTMAVVNEIMLVGSRCGPFAPALRLLAQELVDVQALISARYPLDAAEAALEHAGRRGVLKVVVGEGKYTADYKETTKNSI